MTWISSEKNEIRKVMSKRAGQSSIKGSTDNYTILNKTFFASKILWYEWPRPQIIVMENTASILPCQGPDDSSKELLCYLYISKDNTRNEVEAKLIPGTLYQCLSFFHLLLSLQCPTLGQKCPTFVTCVTIPMTQNILPSLPLLPLLSLGNI